jgi:hypothetical protein
VRNQLTERVVYGVPYEWYCDVGSRLEARWAGRAAPLHLNLTARFFIALLILPVAAASAAPDRKPPRIVTVALQDTDRDFRADHVRLTYSERIRHARDADGKYPFTIAGYRIRSVGAASGRGIVITLVEKLAPDPAAKPAVRYRRTTSKPVRDRAGNQATRQAFARTRAHGNVPPLSSLPLPPRPPPPPPPPPALSGENLALGRPATSSSDESSTLSPAKAVDGSSMTRWGSQFIDNQWWQVDLQAVKTVTRVRVNWETAYASVYKIQTSLDGINYSDQATVMGFSPGLRTTDFPPVAARYVRILGVLRATGYGISFWEAEVYAVAGGNLALGKTANATSTYDPTFSPQQAVDGSSTTRWSSQFIDNQSWEVYLELPRTITRVRVDWEAAYASLYKIQTSLDGGNYSDQATVAISSPGLKTTDFPPVSALWVRILGVTRATIYGISFWEAEVFGP